MKLSDINRPIYHMGLDLGNDELIAAPERKYIYVGKVESDQLCGCFDYISYTSYVELPIEEVEMKMMETEAFANAEAYVREMIEDEMGDEFEDNDFSVSLNEVELIRVVEEAEL